MRKIQDLTKFRLPSGFRGRSALWVQLWWLVQASLFRWSPQIAYPWRVFLLRLFGAKVGKGVLIRPTVRVTYPWKVEIGDHSWVGDDVVLYSLGHISIGSSTVVSQSCYLCAADHDHKSVDFAIRERPISIGDEVWLCADVFVGPSVKVGHGVVVGARSSVFRSVGALEIVCGTPAAKISMREQSTDGDAAPAP